ncbi:MAG: carbohydrate-binding domain-containing protein [Parasporobacterium sp.]|nr:carbohydrate-binding domain-containing protein [Parasporobacterium sp.]
MKKMKKRNMILAAVLGLSLGVSLFSGIRGNAAAAQELSELPGYDRAIAIHVQGQEAQARYAASDAVLSEEELAQERISFDGQNLSLEKQGTYILSGELEGRLFVSSAKKKSVVLALNGLKVENKSGEALEVKKTGELLIYLVGGTENVLTSGTLEESEDVAEEADPGNQAGSANEAGQAGSAAGSGQETAEEEDQQEDPSGGALHSRAVTTIRGEGSLTVNGYINNGIHVSGALTIEAGKVGIVSANDGIKVKDSFILDGGTVQIQSGGDGIQARRDEEIAAQEVKDPDTGEVIREAELASEAAGEIMINGGSLEIDSDKSGLQALLDIQICEGNVSMRTGKDGIKSDRSVQISGGEIRVDTDQDAVFAVENVTVSGGTLDLKAEGEYKHKAGEGESFDGPSGRNRQNSVSRKGIKSDGTITITDGTIRMDCPDDAIHCAGLLQIAGGDIQISSGDDGLHSDVQIDFLDGNVEILASYEGIEANQINIAGGSITLASNDDGFNANGGSSFGGPGGGETAKTKETPNLNISGGEVYVNAVGDGLDSNANITVTGGTVIVDGPTSSMNGPLDGGTENGGVIRIAGGMVFAGGASGMAEGFSSNSEQCSFLITFPASYPAGTLITVTAPDGTELFRHTPASGGNSIVFSCPELEVGSTCTLAIGEYVFEIPLSRVSNSLRASADLTVTERSGGSGGFPGGGFPGGGFPGGPGR